MERRDAPNSNQIGCSAARSRSGDIPEFIISPNNLTADKRDALIRREPAAAGNFHSSPLIRTWRHLRRAAGAQADCGEIVAKFIDSPPPPSTFVCERAVCPHNIKPCNNMFTSTVLKMIESQSFLAKSVLMRAGVDPEALERQFLKSCKRGGINQCQSRS
ncbi:hypothetical protein F2P81_019582 [Scophthalmus maximus]|uniref:Uncharacterized protein n=1 Tax=Scophthalmus maximus TaxID=52904 RepID=A0A6A4S874_SCOMX|nr:hypothetical protein F2P81_019582 [Scophthalmus maximus]